METDFATTLRRFELKLLQEMGYAVPLLQDENDAGNCGRKNLSL